MTSQSKAYLNYLPLYNLQQRPYQLVEADDGKQVAMEW